MNSRHPAVKRTILQLFRLASLPDPQPQVQSRRELAAGSSRGTKDAKRKEPRGIKARTQSRQQHEHACARLANATRCHLAPTSPFAGTMLPWTAVLLLLQRPLSVCSSAAEDCLLRRGTSVRKDGDVLIGGFFSLYYCFFLTGIINMEPRKDFLVSLLMPNSYQNALAMVFATEEINRNPQLLPNVSLGYEFHNFLYSHWRMLESSLILHSGQDEIPNYTCGKQRKSVALLTGTVWATAAQIGTFLELYRFPQLTFGSFDPALSENSQFPSLYQIPQKDTSLASGMVSLLLHFSWTWVGLLITESQKGSQFLLDLTAEMDRNNICAAFVKMISNILVSYLSPTKLHDFLTRETSPVNVVVIYYDTDSLNDINYHVERQLVTWRVWVTNSQWHVDMTGKNFILDSFHGTIIFSNHHEEISGFKNFVQTANPSTYPEDTVLALYWLRNFRCSLSDSDCALEDCPPNASLALLPANRFDPAMSEGSYNVYNAVYAVAYALHEMLLQSAQIQPVGNGEQVVVSPWQIPQSVCSVSCNPGSRKTPQEGKPVCCFDCILCPENEITNDTDMDQCLKCSNHQYANSQQNHCLPKFVTFLSYEDPLGKMLVTTATSLLVLTAAVLGLFVKHRDTPLVKASNQALSYILLISLGSCFLCSLLFIGRPNASTCVLQQTMFGLVFTVAVSTVLAKTVTVVLAFKVTAPGRRMRQLLVSGAPNSIIPICSLIQLTLCGIWMGTSPPFIDTDAHSEHGHIIIVCNKGSLTAFYCVLGYLGSLALGSFTVAFLARNLPDTFNEAKYLTFSMLVFCSVWVTFLPVYHSTQGKVMVAMEVFAILASGAGLLGCIFVPKCYIILFRPERNSVNGIRDKTHSRRKKPL
ncbi:vomeronasal type-2 receptor 116-like [Ctenodactylus gundi]